MPETVTSVAFSPDGQRIASASQDGTTQVWDASTGQETLTLKGHTDNVSSVAFSPDGKRIVSCSFDNTIKIWDATFASNKAASEAGGKNNSPATQKTD